MKKISSAIFLATFLVFINCKSNVGGANNPDSIDSTSKFYQSVIALGNGFLDVFKSFGELVAETIGFKADPKKSEVKNYFTSMITKLEATKKGLVDLPKGNGEEGKGDAKGAVKSAAESVAALIEKLITAAKEVETAATGSEAVGTVVKAADGAGAADKDSVKGIAKGIKAIVEAVGAAAKLTAGNAKEGNEDAGKLFAGKKDGANKGGDEKDASKAAGAVSAVSGEQIIKAIVDAAGKEDKDQGGKKAEDATNPIQAAIGTAGDDEAAFGKEMKKDDQIAAAIALRGMAKDGKFAVKDDKDAKGAVKSAAESAAALIEKLITAAKEVADAATGSEAVGTVVKADANAGAGARVADKNSVKGIAKGIKAIVEAVGGEKLKAAGAAKEGGNENAGKLFAGKKGGANGGDEKDASKAAGAVSAVSGEQIIKAIVDAVGKEDKEQEGKKAEEAANPIQAAIGEDNEDEAAFEKAGMKKDYQIAAAIALRGMAKNGKFAVKDANEEDAKGAVKSAAESVAELIGKLITAAKEVADAATGSEAVGTVVKADAAGDRVADANSVKGIAKGIKAIVEAVGAAKLTAGNAANGEENKDAGKLFGKGNNGGDEKDASKAAGAVSAVSGEQIIKAIVDAVGKDQEGKKAEEAANPIQAAIGTAGDDAAKAFDKMKKDDQIAAAIALRGMAKNGKFAVKDANEEDAKGAVKSAAESVAELIGKLITAAKAVETAATGSEAVGTVVKTAAAGAGAADANSVGDKSDC
ncbi:variable large family protein [Borreliella afzelii]|uniref:variable large family protein n=1 Tax=Borreliella afzelii TaxID=29518 RepID=UPI000662BDFD